VIKLEIRPSYPKSKRAGIIAGIASLLLISASGFIFYQVGHSQAAVTLHDKKLTVATIDKEIESSGKEYDKIWSNVSDVKRDLKKIQSEYDEAKSIVSKKDELTKNVQDLQKSIDNKNEYEQKMLSYTKYIKKQKKIQNGCLLAINHP
jgi:septal ring factor EnvC (AmiA/AmiB activator)